ncbi:hypothetical protein K438DRAFT_2019148 [Mycena galopus ATCC 62051]|nr:hypothetical protein K438DRAFT_2019148 [Mycena galopus ATCC 62051]
MPSRTDADGRDSAKGLSAKEKLPVAGANATRHQGHNAQADAALTAPDRKPPTRHAAVSDPSIPSERARSHYQRLLVRVPSASALNADADATRPDAGALYAFLLRTASTNAQYRRGCTHSPLAHGSSSISRPLLPIISPLLKKKFRKQRKQYAPHPSKGFVPARASAAPSPRVGGGDGGTTAERSRSVRGNATAWLSRLRSPGGTRRWGRVLETGGGDTHGEQGRDQRVRGNATALAAPECSRGGRR